MWEGVGVGRAEREVPGVVGEEVGDQLGLSVHPTQQGTGISSCLFSQSLGEE